MLNEPAIDEDVVGGLELTGRVVGLDRAPVGDAEVWLDTAPRRSTRSAPDGTFAFDRLASRAYVVKARTAEWIGAQTYRLGTPSLSVETRLDSDVRLRVRVVDTEGRPISGADVCCAADAATARTTAAGEALLAPLSRGHLDLWARAPGFAPSWVETAAMQTGTCEPVTVTLRTGVAIRGRVLDEDGAGVADARLFVAPADGYAPGRESEPAATTDADGRFCIPAVVPGPTG